MLKLRILLLSNYLYIFLLIITGVYCFIIINIGYQPKYKLNETEIKGYIYDIKINNQKLSIIIIGKEKVLGHYFFKNEETKKLFIKQYRLGDYIKLKGTLKKPNNNTAPNIFNYHKYLLSQNIYYLIDIEEYVFLKDNHNPLYTCKNYISKRINKISLSKDYIKAFILGDMANIDNDVNSSYQQNGITHLFAISGAQVSLLAIVVLVSLKKIKMNEKTRYFITSIILLIYLFMTNFSPSILRATIFFILMAINRIYYFHIKIINILFLTLIITLFLNPFIIYNIGFLFSFVISLFLIIYSNKINKQKNYLKKLVITSYISFLASIPISLYNFYQINFFSILYNLFYVPYISFIVYPLSLITFIFPFLDKLLFILIKFMEETSLTLSNFDTLLILKKPSFIICIIYYLLIILAFKKQYFPLICLFIIHYYYPFLIRKNYFILIDVGQGDSILLILDHQVVLIDTGGKLLFANNKNTYAISNNTIIPLIKSLGYKKIDYLFLTHGDEDHCGEAVNIVNQLKVKQVVFNNDEYNNLEQDLINFLIKKDIKYYQNLQKANIGNNEFHFLNTNIYNNENDNSNVIYTELYGVKLLLMGDASIVKEKDILEKYNLTNIDFLKIGHHGSHSSTSQEFINKINPKNCLISVGKNNRYGHPKESVLNILNNCHVYRTDKDGSIKVEITKKGYKIKTFEP